jgi:hypothetical protein
VGDIITDLDGHWKLDETTGVVAADSSGNGYNGDLINMAGNEWTPGMINNCLEFDGVNQYTRHGDVLDFERTDPFTMACWINYTGSPVDIVMGKMANGGSYRGYALMAISGNIYWALINTNNTNHLSVYITDVTNDGAWHHLVATYDGSSTPAGVKVYLDSISRSKTTFKNNLNATTINSSLLNIGARSGGLTFGGKIDDVRIYSRELVQGDVDDLFAWRDVQASWPLLNQRNELAYNSSQLR